jgi:glucose-1-phosphate thymidylyltransferase
MPPNSDLDIVGVIPAAGKGSRLYPYPSPKELFPVGYQDIFLDGKIQKRPKVISQYIIENIVNAGAKRIMFILGKDKHEIMEYYGDGSRFGVTIAYLYQEMLYGMPYAINIARTWTEQNTVFFGMPDTIIEPKDAFIRLHNYHCENKSELTLGLFRTDNPTKFGMADVDDKGNLTSVLDKPAKSDLQYMWGCACWSPEFTKLINIYLLENPYSGKEVVLGDIFQRAVEVGMKVKGLPFKDGRYMDIGTAEELDNALKNFHL